MIISKKIAKIVDTAFIVLGHIGCFAAPVCFIMRNYDAGAVFVGLMSFVLWNERMAKILEETES